MSYSRNFCTIENSNARDTLGHAYSGRQAIIQQKILTDPINGIFYVDNEQPSEDEIFKINYPIGSIFTSQRPLVEYQGATRLTQNRPDNITYSFHGCVFRYIYAQYHQASDHTLVSTGRVLLNQRDLLYYEAPEVGGQSQAQFTLSGDDLVQPAQINESQLAQHNHQAFNGQANCNLAQGNDYTGIFLPGGPSATSTPVNTTSSGSNASHTHDFRAIGTIQVDPPRLPIFMYERIR